mmetsp:Transcript_39158/g.70225  ORF Transcript_39158/g.70225 Transcript_39158/m.70225 type:complete len:282 (-) Transcript_39158:4435-5280(-)
MQLDVHLQEPRGFQHGQGIGHCVLGILGLLDVCMPFGSPALEPLTGVGVLEPGKHVAKEQLEFRLRQVPECIAARLEGWVRSNHQSHQIFPWILDTGNGAAMNFLKLQLCRLEHVPTHDGHELPSAVRSHDCLQVEVFNVVAHGDEQAVAKALLQLSQHHLQHQQQVVGVASGLSFTPNQRGKLADDVWCSPLVASQFLFHAEDHFICIHAGKVVIIMERTKPYADRHACCRYGKCLIEQLQKGLRYNGPGHVSEYHYQGWIPSEYFELPVQEHQIRRTQD